MKLLLVTDSYLPVISGSALIVHRQAIELEKRGHKVTLLCMGTSAKTQVKKISKNITLITVSSVKNPTRSDHYIPFIFPRDINKIFKEVKPDIIHIHSPGPLGMLCLIYAKKLKYKYVVSCYGVPSYAASYFNFLPGYLTRLLERVLWVYYKWFYQNIPIITVLSEFPQREFRDHGIRSKIEIIPMWIDNSKNSKLSKVSLLRKWKIPAGKKNFLYLGRLDKDKDLKTLISAFTILINKTGEKYKNRIHLIFTGAGTERSSLEKMVKDNRITGQVTFTGKVDPGIVNEIYQISDYFVMPGPFETQSIATVQAIAYGLYALVADSGALPEIRKRLPEKCSTFVASDPDSLVEKMSWLLEKSPDKKYIPGKFHSFYSKDSVIDRIEEIYNNIYNT